MDPRISNHLGRTTTCHGIKTVLSANIGSSDVVRILEKLQTQESWWMTPTQKMHNKEEILQNDHTLASSLILSKWVNDPWQKWPKIWMENVRLDPWLFLVAPQIEVVMFRSPKNVKKLESHWTYCISKTWALQKKKHGSFPVDEALKTAFLHENLPTLSQGGLATPQLKTNKKQPNTISGSSGKSNRIAHVSH